MSSTIVRYIAAAAAHGFEGSISHKQPRTAAQWVAHCRSAAAEAEAQLRADPPPRPGSKEPGPLAGILGNVQRDIHLAKLERGEPSAWTPPAQPDTRLSGAELDQAAHAAAAMAYRACMPLLTSRQAVRAYIACIAVAAQDGYLDPAEAKALLYNTQLALSAYKKDPKR